jgi:hypothetical protein
MALKTPRVRKMAIGISAAFALVAGGTAVGAATLTTSTHASSHSAVVHHVTPAQERLALLRYLRNGIRPNVQVKGLANGVNPSSPNINAGSRGTASTGSYNWSGYADETSTPNTFSAVSASWVQPPTTCSPEQELTAFWVGLDGFNNGTVEQDGTLSYCFEGQASYYSWWEMYPGGSVTVGSTVRPGDLISASVKRTGTNYTLSLTDLNHPANGFSTVQSCTTCTNTSAEWIAERPAFSIGVTPLTYFTPWTAYAAQVTANGKTGGIASGPDATQITMVDATDTYPLTVVSGLQLGGFNDRWLNSY